MQLALYRAERPEIFEDIIGQKHIVRILQNQLRTGTVSQAYLFSGTHGTGKTTTARILAKAVNCLEGEPGTAAADLGGGRTIPCGHCANCEAIREGRFVDCIELDAASNNGVDDLRAIIDMVKYPPTVGRYKVYIIDEVHMLSTAAENAFLKTLEEPPEHAIFILATTDPQKVRATIRSRCMQLNFKRVTEDELAAGMRRICERRGIEATDDALATIATRADGSVRDALSILEQCAAAGDKRLDRPAVLEYTGAAGEDFYLALTDAVARGDMSRIFIFIDEIIRRGKDARQILKDWLTHYRNLMVVKYVAKAERIVGSSTENIDRLRKQAESIDIADIERAIRLISEYNNIGRYSERPRILLETAAVRLADSNRLEAGAGRSGAGPGSGGAGYAGTGHISSSVRAGTGNSSAAGNSTGSAGRSGAGPGSSTGAGGNVSQIRGSDSDRAWNSDPAGAAHADQFEQPLRIEPAPRELPGSPQEMWNAITDEIARGDRSFVSLVGKHSKGTDYDSGELTVTVRPGKLRLATDRHGDITRTARSLYGQDVFVTLKAGDPEETAEATEQETERIIDEDVILNDTANDVEELFGIKPEIRS